VSCFDCPPNGQCRRCRELDAVGQVEVVGLFDLGPPPVRACAACGRVVPKLTPAGQCPVCAGNGWTPLQLDLG
jgi:hypothetical protein